MAIVVECGSCGSRFHMKESLLRESKAVRFRCRKCGGSIMVRNPYAPPVVPVSTVSPKMAAPPAPADISSVVRPEIEQPTSHETPGPPPATYSPANAVPAPPVLPVSTVPRLEDLVGFSPVKDVVPMKAPLRGKRSPGRNILVAWLSILLLAGGVLYFGITEGGHELLGKWFRGSAPAASAAARPVYEVLEKKSAAYEKTVAGDLFVVSGTVVNAGKGTSRGIWMRAVLLGEDQQVLMENSSLAGNLIDESTLRHMKRDPIEVYLKMEHREGGEDRDIPPGKSLPFMVVFFDPPGKIGSFTVHAVDAE